MLDEYHDGGQPAWWWLFFTVFLGYLSFARVEGIAAPIVLVWLIGNSVTTEAENLRESARLRVDNVRIERLATLGERERIAQLVPAPVLRADFREVAELSETSRGEGGFGSTGR